MRLRSITAGRRHILSFSCALALFWVLAWYLFEAGVAYPHFDGGLNLNVAWSVVEGRGYGSFYERYALFPIETQTNGPYVLPAAAALAWLGLTPFAAQLVNLLYLVGFAGLAGWLTWRACGSHGLAWLVPLVLLQAPGVSVFGMNGYGEIPALTWLLVGMVLIERHLRSQNVAWVVAAGVALGASFLTKTVAMIWMPAAFGALACVLYLQRGLSAAVRDALLAGVGFGLLLVCWELYRLGSLGGLGAYLDWWAGQWSEITKQSGAQEGYRDTPGWAAKFALHAGTLSGLLALPPWLAASFVLSIFALGWWVFRHSERPAARMLLIVLAGTALPYLVWWVLVTPTEFLWLRRIMNGLIALLWLAMLVAWQAWSSTRATVLTRAASVGVFAVALWVTAQGQLLVARPKPSEQAEADRAFHAAVRALPADATTFGSGWWQAPVAALFSERVMHDEEKWNQARFLLAPGDKYLVLDIDALSLGEWTRERLAWRCVCEVIWSNERGAIFRMHALRNTEHTASPHRIAEPTGAYPRDGEFQWISPWFALPVERGVQSVQLGVHVPDLDRFESAAGQPYVEGWVGDCPRRRIALEPGAQTWRFDAECAGDADPVLWIISSARLNPHRIAPDKRDLAWMLGAVSFESVAPAAH